MCSLINTPESLTSDVLIKSELLYSEGGNVRLIQMGVALQHLNHMISEVAPGAPLVFCGDFNSSPNSGKSITPHLTSPRVLSSLSAAGGLIIVVISSRLRCVAAGRRGRGYSAACGLEQLWAGGVLLHGAALRLPPSAERLWPAGVHQLCGRISWLPGLCLHTARQHAGMMQAEL